MEPSTSKLHTLSLHDALPICSAEAGSSEGMHRLGDMYREGLGQLQKDYGQAADWYTRAATEGDAAALTRLGEDRKSTRLDSSHVSTSYVVFYLKKDEAGDPEA